MTMAVVSRHDRIHRPNDRVVLRSAAENLFSVSSNQTERTKVFGSNKTKGSIQYSQNQLRSTMPGRGELFEPFEAVQNQMTREKWMMLVV